MTFNRRHFTGAVLVGHCLSCIPFIPDIFRPRIACDPECIPGAGRGSLSHTAWHIPVRLGIMGQLSGPERPPAIISIVTGADGQDFRYDDSRSLRGPVCIPEAGRGNRPCIDESSRALPPDRARDRRDISAVWPYSRLVAVDCQAIAIEHGCEIDASIVMRCIERLRLVGWQG